MTKNVELINGFTKSAWKSLVIKSMRIGWVEGLQEATKNLPKSEIATVCVGTLFEDTFPVRYKDLNECYHEIKNGEWEKLCSRNTHHGRGYTEAFFNMAEEACQTDKNMAYNRGIMAAIQQNTDIKWINERVYNCLYTWYKINPQKDSNYLRNPLHHKWSGMPLNILDGHTYEGKRKGKDCLLLSGHYENHRHIGKRVMTEGWEPIRNEFINDKTIIAPNTQLNLF